MTVATDEMASAMLRRSGQAPADGVVIAKFDRVLRVTLNRTLALNAIDTAMAARLNMIWRSVRDDPDVEAVLLSGAGAEAFSIGFDRADRPAIPVTARECGVEKRLVVAVNGVACREAVQLIQEADVVIASTHARFFGPLAGGELGAPRVGCAVTSTANRPITAQQALELGLADYVVPLASLQQRALQLAQP